MPQPFIKLAEYPWRLRQSEVGLPTRQITPQFLSHLIYASTAIALRDLTQPPLQRVAQKLPPKRTCHRTLALVDLEPQAFVELAQPRHHPLARFLTAHVHVAVVRIAHKPMATPLQFPIHLVQQYIGQQRRQWPALRRALTPLLHYAALPLPCALLT